MISIPVLLLFSLALFLTLLFPLMLLVLLGLRRKIDLFPLGLGFLSFLLSQILTRIPLLQFLGTQSWYQGFASANRVVFILLVAFSAGLFEETARLGGAALLGPRKPAYPGGPPRPGYRTWKGALSFGLGHGFCELILLAGFTHINNLVYCFLIGSGNTQALAGLLPAGQMEQIVAQFAAIQPTDILAGLLERLSAVLYHLFATGLIFLAFAKKKWWLYPAAILCHTVFNSVSLLPIGMWPIELILFAMGILGVVVFWKSKKWFPPSQEEISVL